ncbi:MAG: hypothetical protein C0623_11940 [Desulfuromonas sp.]|nr:MAG: hypothetical protein C0623_11940 [Desulfuromonas sp.]
MKTMFVTPPVSFRERYGKLSGAGSSAPALGILLLAAVAREAGHEVAVIDAAARNMDLNATLHEINAFCPEVLGISSTTLSISHAKSLAAIIKEAFPDIIIILGGPHVSAVPELTLNRLPDIDIAVLGEGEETIVCLLQAIKESKPLADVEGIVYRDTAGDLIRTKARSPVNELDSLPYPAWDLLEGFPEKYTSPAFKVRKKPSVSLVSSRGCPNECIFCDRSVFGKSCHAYSAEYIVHLIEYLYVEFGVREFSFEDDTFITFKKRLFEICHKLIALNLDISWSCLGRVDHVTSEGLRLMKKAGCWQISYGIESGRDEILRIINKNINLSQIRSAVELTRKEGLNAKGFFIVGNPGETRQTLQQTLSLMLALPLNDISVAMLTPFPGTEIEARVEEFGKFSGDWEKMNLLNTVFVPYGLEARDLNAAQREMLRRFYLRPRVFFDYLGRLISNPRLFGVVFSGFWSLWSSVRSSNTKNL